MPFKNYLFIISLMALMGCNGGGEQSKGDFDKQIDSLTTSHQKTMDSLNQVVKELQIENETLKVKYEHLTDSLGLARNNSDGSPSGPLMTQPDGDPTNVPIKRH